MRSTPIVRKKPMPRTRAPRTEGLGQRVAEALGCAKRAGKKAPAVLRSEQHRRNVASLPCVVTGRPGTNQCGHANFSKGVGRKACDTLTFPICPEAHRAHDQGGIPRETRRRLELEYVDRTRAELIARFLWTPELEAHYQRAIGPMKRAVE